MKSRTAYRAGNRLYAVKRAVIAGAACAVLLASPALAESDPGHGADADAQKYWGMLDTYCTKCHNVTDWAGGVAFDTMTPDALPHDAKTWEAAVEKLRGRLMPPAGNKQPDQENVDAFVGWLETHLDAAARSPNAGHVPIHRLNRTEFAAEVKELIGVDMDPVAILPTELEVDGFSNIASALSVSPAFLDQYVAAARKAAHLAVGDYKGKTQSSFYPAPSYNQYEHIEGMPLGTRGGMQFQHNFTADGEYRFSIKDVGAGLCLRQSFLAQRGRRGFKAAL